MHTIETKNSLYRKAFRPLLWIREVIWNKDVDFTLGTPVSALAGDVILRELNRTKGLSVLTNCTGTVMALRLKEYPRGAYAGAETIAAAIWRLFGIRASERGVRYSLALLKREKFFRVVCCGGELGGCVGGRRRRNEPHRRQGPEWHAAVYDAGDRQFGAWSRRGRYFVRARIAARSFSRSKGATRCAPGPETMSLSPSKKEEEPLRGGEREARAGAGPPGPVRLSELIGEWQPGGAAP